MAYSKLVLAVAVLVGFNALFCIIRLAGVPWYILSASATLTATGGATSSYTYLYSLSLSKIDFTGSRVDPTFGTISGMASYTYAQWDEMNANISALTLGATAKSNCVGAAGTGIALTVLSLLCSLGVLGMMGVSKGTFAPSIMKNASFILLVLAFIFNAAGAGAFANDSQCANLLYSNMQVTLAALRAQGTQYASSTLSPETTGGGVLTGFSNVFLVVAIFLLFKATKNPVAAPAVAPPVQGYPGSGANMAGVAPGPYTTQPAPGQQYYAQPPPAGPYTQPPATNQAPPPQYGQPAPAYAAPPQS